MASFVESLPVASPEEAAALVAAAMPKPVAGVAEAGADTGVQIEAARVPKPGSVIERWPVKTFQDDDTEKVRKKIVDTTISDLGAFDRPDGWDEASKDPPEELRRTRDAPAETTIWRVKANIVGLRLEADRDYHLELQDDSGAMMIAEIPIPQVRYIGKDNPLADDIQAARDAIDEQFNKKVQAETFTLSEVTQKLVPVQAVAPRAGGGVSVEEVAVPDLKALTAESDDNLVEVESFSTRVDPTPVTITGIGFFDKGHGQAGSAPNYIELHPTIKIEFD